MPKYEKADLLEKEPTEVQKRFIKFVKAETGYDMDPTTVVLFQARRMAFQKSPENQEHLQKRRSTASERRNNAKQAKAAKAAAKVQATSKKAAPAKKAVATKKIRRAAKPKPVLDDPFVDA